MIIIWLLLRNPRTMPILLWQANWWTRNPRRTLWPLKQHPESCRIGTKIACRGRVSVILRHLPASWLHLKSLRLLLVSYRKSIYSSAIITIILVHPDVWVHYTVVDFQRHEFPRSDVTLNETAQFDVSTQGFVAVNQHSLYTALNSLHQCKHVHWPC